MTKKRSRHTGSDTATERYRFQKSRQIYIYILLLDIYLYIPLLMNLFKFTKELGEWLRVTLATEKGKVIWSFFLNAYFIDFIEKHTREVTIHKDTPLQIPGTALQEYKNYTSVTLNCGEG